jgi:hypothetical protein
MLTVIYPIAGAKPAAGGEIVMPGLVPGIHVFTA